MQSQQDVRVTVRVDKDLKENAEMLFNRLGMNMSVAFNVFLRKAVDEQAIPFKIGVGSNRPSGAYDVDMVTSAFQAKVAEEIAESIYENHPVALYDKEKDDAYLLYPNGQREYVSDKEKISSGDSKEVSSKRPRSELRGLLKGRAWMADDFNAPLEDMEEYM